MSKVKAVRKFLVALGGVVVAFGLLDEGTAQDLVGIATAIAVYLVPNE